MEFILFFLLVFFCYAHRSFYSGNKYILISLVIYFFLTITSGVFVKKVLGKNFASEFDDQQTYLAYGDKCASTVGIGPEGESKIAYKEIGSHIKFVSLYEYISCLAHKYSVGNAEYTLLFLNIVLCFVSLTLIAKTVYNLTLSYGKSCIALWLVMLCPSLFLYQLYILKDLCIYFFNTSFFYLFSLLLTKKKWFLLLIPLMFLNLFLLFSLRLQSIILPISISTLYYILIWSKNYKISLSIVLIIAITLWGANYFSWIDFVYDKYNYRIFFSSVDHLKNNLKNVLGSLTGITFVIPSIGINDKMGIWFIKRFLTYDRILIPLGTLVLAFFSLRREGWRFILIMLVSIFLYQGVWYFQAKFLNANVEYGFRQAIPLFAYYPFFVVYLGSAFLDRHPKIKSKLLKKISHFMVQE